MKKKILISLGISIISIIVIFAFSTNGTRFDQIGLISSKYLLGLIVIYSLQWIIGAWRVQVAAIGLGKRVKFLRALKIGFCGDYFALITPSSLGGQPAKIVLLSSDEERYGKSSAIVVLENATEMLFFLFLIPIVLLQNPIIFGLMKGYSWVFIPITFLLTAGLIYVVMVKSHWIALVLNKFLELPLLRKLIKEERRKKIVNAVEHEIGDFVRAVEHYIRNSKIHLFSTLLLSVIYWSLRFSLLYLVIRGFGIDITFWLVYQIQIMLFFFTLFVPAPGGGAEFIMAFLLKGSIPSGLTTSIILNWRIFSYFLTLLIGTLVLLKNTVPLYKKMDN